MGTMMEKVGRDGASSELWQVEEWQLAEDITGDGLGEGHSGQGTGRGGEEIGARTRTGEDA